MREDVSSGLVTHDGALKRQKREVDPWLESIEQEQEQRLKNEIKNYEGSDLAESEDEGLGRLVNEDELEIEGDTLKESQNKKIEAMEIKRNLVKLMLEGETVSQALNRLRPARQF